MKSSHFSTDIQEFLFLLSEYQVSYVIVGGEAVIYYGYTRLTGDIDIFFEASPENVKKLYSALTVFWEGSIPGLKDQTELLEIGVIIQFGVPPNRIDLINKIENVFFKEAWGNKVSELITVNGKIISVYFIGLHQLIQNKESLERPKDLEDLKYLRRKLE
jgi:predicted nucleotidyltransferase